MWIFCIFLNISAVGYNVDSDICNVLVTTIFKANDNGDNNSFDIDFLTITGLINGDSFHHKEIN